MFKNSEQIGNFIASYGVMLSQTFEERKDYEINYKWNGGQCYVDINEIIVNKLGLVEKIFLYKKINRLNNEFSNICIKNFNKGDYFKIIDDIIVELLITVQAIKQYRRHYQER